MSILSDEAGMFERGVRMTWPGARGSVDISYIDLESTFLIKFSNGALIQGREKNVVIADAIAYAKVVKRLTGKTP